MILVMFFVTISPISGLNLEEKIDETPVTPSPPDSGIECTACSSCENPCQYSPPPPPPSPILPPPPPPPPPKTPSKPDCPPPPSGYITPPMPPSGYLPPYGYVPPPPGSLYPVDPNYHFSSANREYGNMFLVLVGCSVFGILASWSLLL